jgi:hypothetical protein
MALVYPLDILADFPGWTTEFDLVWRQEVSRTAGGRTIVKDLGSPLWRAAFASRPLRPNQLEEWRARLDALENGHSGATLSRVAFPSLIQAAAGRQVVYSMARARSVASV